MSKGSHCQLGVTLLCSFDGLSTISIHYLYSTLRVMTRPLDTIHKKAAFEDNNLVPIKLFIDYIISLKINGSYVYVTESVKTLLICTCNYAHSMKHNFLVNKLTIQNFHHLPYTRYYWRAEYLAICLKYAIGVI